MSKRTLVNIVFLLGGLFIHFSCIGIAPTQEVQQVDSLNNQAYFFQYRNLDSLFTYAQKAYNEVRYYRLGKAEASNHLGFYYFMKMDFEEALKWHKKVYSITQNEVELLIADIAHMRISQRTGRNKEYYDYRNSALQRMNQIAEDYTVFIEKKERLRIFYAYSEFYFVSALYHYYLQQQEEAKLILNEYEQALESNVFWSLEQEKYKDDSQELYHHYIKGLIQLDEVDFSRRTTLSAFDELLYTWFLAKEKGYPFFMGCALEGISELMIRPSVLQLLLDWRVSGLKQMDYPIDENLPLLLLQEALSIFRTYNDLYQTVGAYVTLGEYLNVKGKYLEALDTLSVALKQVNRHHQQYYHQQDSLTQLDLLKNYDPTIEAGNYVEIQWIEKHLLTVPEWIARIREQLSFTYAGLGKKVASDFNRNIYLDILDYSRQDKEIESRYGALKQEEKNLNIILFIAFIVALITLTLFVWFYRISQKKNDEYVKNLQTILELCKNITSTVLIKPKNKEELATFLVQQLFTPFQKIFDVKHLQLGIVDDEEHLVFYEYPVANEATQALKKKEVKTSYLLVDSLDESKTIGILDIYTRQTLSKEKQVLISIVIPYLSWSIENGVLFFLLGEEYEMLDKERYVYEQRISRNVRENINKKACLAVVDGIHPYIDRIINEIQKLKTPYFFNNEAIRKEKYEYIQELVTRINEYNEVLSLWIKIKQGAIQLNIESFSLKEVFDIISKGSKWFEFKRQTFIVDSTDSWVRADKALTLFMINTLLDNARKYTPEGGTIQLQVEEAEDYVEVSISDTGVGLSQEDVKRILHEKVYDAQEIGLDQKEEHKNEILKQKGSGFGLMNCKGIIEKYKKTSNQFKVSQFGVESQLGKGSRFYFRLPHGLKRMLILLGIFFFPFTVLTSKNESYLQNREYAPIATDSLSYLIKAMNYADSVYYANLNFQYEKALEYVQISIDYLNKHCHNSQKNLRSLSLISIDKPAEIDWWNAGLDADYHTILDIRNEAAVAFMALKNWEGYQYNNEAFTRLYKMLGIDYSLELYCRELERSRSGKVIGITLILLFPLLFGLSFYFIYIRKRLLYRWNLEQLFEVNQCFFSSSSIPLADGEIIQREEDTLKKIPQQITEQSFETINELFSVDRVGLAVFNESAKKLDYSYNPPKKELVPEIEACFTSEEKIINEGKYAYPLWVDVGGVHQKVGVFYLEKKEGQLQAADEVLLQLMVSYLSVVVFNAVIRLANRYRDIESAQEETQRASWEEGVLHVQNMVLDNCLSTLKHETIYYPNKVKKLLAHLLDDVMSLEQEQNLIFDIDELVTYYKDVFSLLNRWSNKQLEEITFKRKVISVDELLNYTLAYFNKKRLAGTTLVSLEIGQLNESVLGDENQLKYLMENLIDATLYNQNEGVIILTARVVNHFIEFSLVDERQNRLEEELRTLFYPNLQRMEQTAESSNTGIEYLLCKQIIREQEEYVGRRGCRIVAEKRAEGGDEIKFTLPKR